MRGIMTGGWFDGKRAILEGSNSFPDGKKGTMDGEKSIDGIVSLATAMGSGGDDGRGFKWLLPYHRGLLYPLYQSGKGIHLLG